MSEEVHYGRDYDSYDDRDGRRFESRTGSRRTGEQARYREGFAGTIFLLLVIAFAILCVLQSGDMG